MVGKEFHQGTWALCTRSNFIFSDIAVNLERKHMESRWHISQTAKQILRGFREHVLQGVSTATWWSWWPTFVLHLDAEEARHDHSSVSCLRTGARFPALLGGQMLLTNAFLKEGKAQEGGGEPSGAAQRLGLLSVLEMCWLCHRSSQLGVFMGTAHYTANGISSLLVSIVE